jgi:Calcineurin-like phosphoesterase
MFYVTSDLHLEFYSNIESICSKIRGEIEPTPLEERVLFLCGDIGHPFKKTYSEFLKFCSENFEHVVIITGNHEYYNTDDDEHTMEEIDSQIEILAISYSNVFFLKNSYCILKEFKIIVLGSTLWSKPHTHNAYKGINDFNYIVTEQSKKTSSNLSLFEYNALHNSHLEKLTDKVVDISSIREREEYSDYELIVMTHHLPSRSLIAPNFKGSSINQFFATDLDYLFETFNADPTTFIKYWFCGHTHTRTEAEIHGTKVTVHPYGYPNEYEQENRTILHSVRTENDGE